MTRKSAIARVRRSATKVASNVKQGVALRWTLATDLVELRGTFKQGEEKAFLATAATAAQLDESVVASLVKAHETRAGLTKAQQAKVQAWPTDSILPFRGMETADITKVIAKAEKAGTTNTKVIRDLKRQVVGTAKRTRQTDAAKTTKLAEVIGDEVRKLLDNGHNPMTLAAGANLARKHGGDVGAAILFVAANAKAATPVVK